MKNKTDIQKDNWRSILLRKVALLLLLFVAINLSFINSVGASGTKHVVEGQKVIDFTVKDVDGSNIHLADYQGKVIVLNFWTTWCAYCQEEMEEMVKFSSEADSAKIKLIAINVTASEKSEQAVINFAKDSNIPFQIGLDSNGEVAKTYQLIGIPTTYIIDQVGIVRKKILGPITADILKSYISELE